MKVKTERMAPTMTRGMAIAFKMPSISTEEEERVDVSDVALSYSDRDGMLCRILFMFSIFFTVSLPNLRKRPRASSTTPMI